MATYTTIFFATKEELITYFDARESLKEFEVRSGTNPFTGESIEYKTWDPGPKSMPVSLLDIRDRQRAEPLQTSESDYERFLESNVPNLIASFPHIALKGIVLELLPKAILGDNSPPDYFLDCVETEGHIGVLPNQALKSLAAINESALRQIAMEWESGFSDEDENFFVLNLLKELSIKAMNLNSYLCCHSSVG